MLEIAYPISRAVHEGIRDVQCSECGKFFREKHNLKDHIRKVHTKKKVLKVIPCENCDKTYSTISALR